MSKTHPIRIFFISGLITVVSLAGVAGFMGPQALFIATILILVEITFSFENAIINAKVLSTVSEFWRKIFITLGILIAVVGMRLIFPIAIVAITANLPTSCAANGGFVTQFDLRSNIWRSLGSGYSAKAGVAYANNTKTEKYKNSLS